MTDRKHYQLDEYYIDLQQQAQGMEIADEVTTRNNPYPGLRPFRTAEAHLFFGREGQAEELISRLMDTRFLGVLGNSGSGKSSLVRAGLIPALHAGKKQARIYDWKIVICRPGNSPLENLAAALAGARLRSTDRHRLEPEVARLLAQLGDSSFGLLEAEGPADPQQKTLLIVDQFEELFRFARDIAPGQAAQFVDLLITAVQQPDAQVHVVITMRSEFLGECVHYRGLPEIINQGQYLVPRLTNENLRRAIAGPLAVVGAPVEGALVNRLLRELGDDMDQLPLLQHALMRTYQHWQRSGGGRPIGHDDYDATGGIKKALGQHADEHYEAMDEQGRNITRLLFQRLTDSSGDKGGRRPTRMDEIYGLTAALPATRAAVDAVIEQLRQVDTSFLMPPPGVSLEDDNMLDIAHESLIRNWARLADWAAAEADNARLYQRLQQATDDHRQDENQGWIMGALLERLRKWQSDNHFNGYWAARYHTAEDMYDWPFHERLFGENTAFLEACVEREAAEKAQAAERLRQQAEAEAAIAQAAKERALRAEAEGAKAEAEKQHKLADENARRAGRRTRLAVLVSLLALVLAGLAGVFYVRAAEDRERAEAAKDSAEVAKTVAVGAKNEAEANLQEAERQRQKALAATQEAEKNYAAAQANLRRAEQEEKRAKAALVQVEREKAATEAQRRIAEENYAQAQEASRLAKAEEENARRALAELTESNKEVVRLLLKNVERDVLDSKHVEAYQDVKSAASLGVLKDSVATEALKLAFWFGEADEPAKADTMLQTAYKLLEKQVPKTSTGLMASIEMADKLLFDTLLTRYLKGYMLSTEYDRAYKLFTNGGRFERLKAFATETALELAFWYGESGQRGKADTMLQTAYGLLNKRPDSSQSLRAAIAAADGKLYDKFMHRYYPLDTVKLAGGTFDMGCKPGRDDVEKCDDGETLHKQTVSTFIITRHEISWWQFRLFCEATKHTYEPPDWGIQGDNPVVNVSWYDAVEYANWLSSQLGLPAAYNIDKNTQNPTYRIEDGGFKWTIRPKSGSYGYRLPTEAEWEYATRGGQEQAYAGCSSSEALKKYAWYSGNSGRRTQPVKSKKPNAYGLYDMCGNVWEWCWDWHGYYPEINKLNYTGSAKGSSRVLRGGSWYDGPVDCRVAYRNRRTPGSRGNTVGFRLVLIP